MGKLIIFCLLFLPVLATAQKLPIRGDNTFIIHTEYDEEYNFRDFGKHLIDAGYTFANKDSDFFSLTTAERNSERGKIGYKMHVSFIN